MGDAPIPSWDNPPYGKVVCPVHGQWPAVDRDQYAVLAAAHADCRVIESTGERLARLGREPLTTLDVAPPLRYIDPTSPSMYAATHDFPQYAVAPRPLAHQCSIDKPCGEQRRRPARKSRRRW